MLTAPRRVRTQRRWRAAQKAGLQRVPVVVREIVAGQERSLLEMALTARGHAAAVPAGGQP